ncbi:Hypothetical_protein [Hexamita inflata]|uniref:Hypothetical_protein n=1 Tax=Hexamita inflata TaxID=28002 RepID=A0ABP1JGK8_9EUKA
MFKNTVARRFLLARSPEAGAAGENEGRLHPEPVLPGGLQERVPGSPRVPGRLSDHLGGTQTVVPVAAVGDRAGGGQVHEGPGEAAAPARVQGRAARARGLPAVRPQECAGERRVRGRGHRLRRAVQGRIPREDAPEDRKRASGWLACSGLARRVRGLHGRPGAARDLQRVPQVRREAQLRVMLDINTNDDTTHC